MHDERHIQDTLALHVRAAGRPDAETERLTSYIVEACWPGGPDDRSEPVARGWLRAWARPAPVLIVVDVPRCRCATGRCTICN
jgi:hypothetical protein